MKIALVHDWLTGMRGGEKCLEVLCRRFPDAQLFTLLHAPGKTSPAIERMQIHTSFLQHIPGIQRRYRYLLPLMPSAVGRFQIPADVDLVVSFSHAVAKSIRPPRGVPHICYCFTPMRYAWHLRNDYFAAPDAQQLPTEDGSAGYGVISGKLLKTTVSKARNVVLDRIRDWDRATADRVTHFVAISRTIAERIRECYGRESTIIYPPVDTDFYTPTEAPRSDTYLCVSALAPYKRIDLAVAACRQLGRKLIVIGQGPEEARLKKFAGEDIQLLGWQSDECIRDHFRNCRALLFPGHEDFGIVPLEAQACGMPVIAYGQGGATETVLPVQENQSGTGRFFKQQTAPDLADALTWLEDHPQQFSSQLARQQAEKFNTSRYEQELVAYLEQVAEERSAVV